MFLTDISKQCVECQKDFIITKGEREFFAMKKDEKGKPLQEPKRCKECRIKKKRERARAETEKETEKKVEAILSGDKYTL